MSKRKSFWRTFSVRTLLVLTTLACCIVAWRVYQFERGTINDWIDAVLAKRIDDPGLAFGSPSSEMVPCPRDIPRSAQINLLMKSLRWLPTSERRGCVLKIIAEQFPAEAHDLFREIYDTTSHDSLRRDAMLLTSLFRIERDIEYLEKYLDDPNPEIRAAAIDAIGVIHKPSFTLPVGVDNVFGRMTYKGQPSIQLYAIQQELRKNRKDSQTPNSLYQFSWDDNQDRLVSDRIKNRIRELWLTDSDQEVRSAASRAMRNWNPKGFQLRVAEWGVWINEGEDLKLAESIIDEIPEFVHRVGNDMASISKGRSQSRIFVTKPIVHISVDQPLVVDISTRIDRGRPWFVYPKPDDFSVKGSTLGLRTRPLMEFENPDSIISGNDENGFEPLTDMREGYPWMAPSHQLHYALGFKGVGFRWQTLLASPEKLDWMTIKPITEEKYSWWERLRQVNSSWVSNRGESERFLFYDGPTENSSPVVVFQRNKGVYVSTPHPLPPETEFNARLLLIEVDGDRVAASESVLELSWGDLSGTLVPDDTMPIRGDEVERRLLSCLTDLGLNRDEAQGLIDCWRPQFLETEGRRMLTIFGNSEYEDLCPISVSPPPTEMSRVGIVLTELGKRKVDNK